MYSVPDSRNHGVELLNGPIPPHDPMIQLGVVSALTGAAQHFDSPSPLMNIGAPAG